MKQAKDPLDRNDAGSESESLDATNAFDMDAFLEEDGYNEFVKEEESKKKEDEKKKQAKANGEKLAFAVMTKTMEEFRQKEEEKEDESMWGNINMQKTKIENRNGSDLMTGIVTGVGDLTSQVTDVFTNKVLKRQSFFAIKKGVLYMYENQKARIATESFKIDKITAISIEKELESKKFRMIYENFFFSMECESHAKCRKWVTSIKYVQENYEEYEENDDDNPMTQKKANRYSKLKVFQKVTGKSCFKDYDVLMESYE